MRMVISLAAAWRLALAIAFCLAIFMSACARAPRQSVPGTELRRLVLCALLLYAVGAMASLTHHQILAGFVYGAGIIISVRNEARLIRAYQLSCNEPPKTETRSELCRLGLTMAKEKPLPGRP